MATQDSWLTALTSAIAALGPMSPLSIDGPADRAAAQRLALGGFPGVLPLWTRDLLVVGLLAGARGSARVLAGNDRSATGERVAPSSARDR